MRVLALAVAALVASAEPRSAAAAAPEVAGAPPPSGVAAFSRHSRFVEAKISPKGTYLAAISQEDGRRSLVFVNLAKRAFVWRLKPGDSMVGRFYWVNDERVVVELVDEGYDLGGLVSRGELYAVDATGKNGRLVFGYRAGEDQTGSHVRKGESERAWGWVLDTLRGDDRRILVAATLWEDATDRHVRVYKLDVYTGVKTFVTQAPIRQADVLTDEDGEVRIAVGVDAALGRHWYQRDGGDWRELAGLGGLSPAAVPLGFSARDRTIHVVEQERTGFALNAVSAATGERRLLARNDFVAPSDLVLDRGGRVVAVEWEPDLPFYDFVDPEHPASRVIRGLEASFPDQHVRLVSRTEDETKAIVHVYGDRSPGEFLLVDVAKMSAEPVAATRPWIAAAAMAEMSAFHIAASDGFRIHGYVTLPRAKGAGAPPLVVLPHGGPHGIRDTWGFDPEVQLLASEGFAVLQVNYRGSAGYGDAYEEAGYRRWGDRVVQDVVDATRWALRKGYGDPARVCAYGGSFGAYAALQGAILAPDLFRCAVGYAGIYDLGLLSSRGDVSQTRPGRDYVRAAVGVDEAALRAASPVHNAGRLVARVLLVHGKQDERAPFAHAERMRDALAAAGRPPEWLVEPLEAHGFHDEAARERMYARVVAFLKESTAAVPGAAPAAAPAAR